MVAIVPNGCSDSITRAVTINANPNTDFSYIRTGNKVDLKAKELGHLGYKWIFGTTDSVTSSTSNYSYTLTLPAQNMVCLSITNTAGCQSKTCKNVTLGISNLIQPKGFKIYPNPNGGQFTIEIDNPEKNLSIEIYDLIGKLVKTVETEIGKSSYMVDLTNADGLYLVKVKNGERVWCNRVVVTK